MPNCWAILILPSAWAPGLSNAPAAARDAARRVREERLKVMEGCRVFEEVMKPSGGF